MDYGTKPNQAEFETSRLISMGVPAEFAYPLGKETAYLIGTGMSETKARQWAVPNVRHGVNVRRFQARIEYAAKRDHEMTIRPVVEDKGIPCGNWYEECREKSTLSAGCWVGD